MELLWGEDTLNWETVLFVSKMLIRHHESLQDHYGLRPTRVRHLNRRFMTPPEGEEYTHSRRSSFVYELHLSRTRKATDPKDRVYSKLGHFSASLLLQNSPRLDPDYSKSQGAIYADIAVRALSGYPTLELLNAVQHCDGMRCLLIFVTMLNGDTDDKSLPSWVPDWDNDSDSAMRKVMGIRGTWFCAAGITTPCLSIQDCDRILEVKGLEVDRIGVSSQELDDRDFRFTSLRDIRGNDSVVLRLLGEICQCSTFTLEREHISGESAVFAFCQTLTAGCMRIISLEDDPRSVYHSTSSDIWLKHGAAYLARVIGEPELISEDIREAGKGGDAFAWNGAASMVCRRRSFFRTAKGYYGLGPSELEINDVVVVLFGGTTPYVLRQTDQGYYFVGECYVYGLMNGEAITMMERGELKEKTFEIR